MTVNPDIYPAGHSNEINEIIGQPPSWLVRRGTGLFLFVLLILLAGASVYRYPDVVRTRAILVTENPPVPLVARENGRIAALLVANGQAVQQGELLAVIENPARTRDVLELKRILDRNPREEGYAGIRQAGKELILGEVQPFFAAWQKAVSDFRHFRELDLYGKKIRSIREELATHRQSLEHNRQQLVFLEQEYQLSRKQYIRDSLLYQSGAIAASDHERSLVLMLQKGKELETARIELSSASIMISEKEREILDLELEEQETENTLIRQIDETEEVLRSAIAGWEQQFLLRSPADGQVSFTRFWSRDQFVREGMTVMTIVPDRAGRKVGRAYIGQQRLGKVHPGQKVLIRLDNFPYLEFGLLEAEVDGISKVPEEGKYVVEMHLPDSLVTHYGIPLPFKEGMEGQAEIITDERSLLRRILEPFRYIFERHFRGRDLIRPVSGQEN